METVAVTRSIPAPRERVWEVYTDWVSWSDWAGIGRVRLGREGSPSPNGTGCVRVIRSAGVSVEEEIVSFDPPSSMSYRVVRGGIPIKNHLGEVFFEDQGGSTLVRWRCRFASRIPGLGFLWRAIVRSVFQRTLAALERYPFASTSGSAGERAG